MSPGFILCVLNLQTEKQTLPSSITSMMMIIITIMNFICNCLCVSLYRRLDANHISSVPIGCFSGLRSLRHLWLDDNSLAEVPVEALSELPGLQAMTLALNHISHVPDRAFSRLGRLVVLYVHMSRNTSSDGDKVSLPELPENSSLISSTGHLKLCPTRKARKVETLSPLTAD